MFKNLLNYDWVVLVVFYKIKCILLDKVQSLSHPLTVIINSLFAISSGKMDS